jgi:hypothetical protein
MAFLGFGGPLPQPDAVESARKTDRRRQGPVPARTRIPLLHHGDKRVCCHSYVLPFLRDQEPAWRRALLPDVRLVAEYAEVPARPRFKFGQVSPAQFMETWRKGNQ